MKKKLERLTKVDLREFWEQESEFTNWLSQEENLILLSDEVGINIKLVQTEASAGNFSVDILAEEENTGKRIIIENQLENTDHNHLGKLITYASAHNAEFIIWIVKEVRSEHKEAIDWLNNYTDENINFFLIKIELWKIGNSPVAPKFEIVSKPSDWSKAIKKAARSGELSELALKELEFLNRFASYCKEKGTTLRLGRAQPSTPGYYTMPIGFSGVWMAIKLNVAKQILKVDLYFRDKDLFYRIRDKYGASIKNKFRGVLEWDELPQSRGATVGKSINFNLDNESKWEGYYKIMKGTAEKLQEIFVDVIKNVKEEINFN